MFDQDDESSSFSYWPSAADLFLTLFIIAIAMLAAVFCVLLPTNATSAINQAVGSDMQHIRKPMNELREVIGQKPIPANTSPALIVASLSETTTAAISEIKKLRKDVESLNEKLQDSEIERKNLETKYAELEEQFRRLKKQLGDVESERDDLKRQLNDKPPIINLTGNRDKDDQNAPPPIVFPSGKATLKPEFIASLRKQIFPEVGALLKKYTTIDTLEIVGHTDGAKVSTQSNLDQSIAEHFAGADNFSTMAAGSNCDLGLMRALAIRQAWGDWLSDTTDADDRLRQIDIRCYSAAQTVPPQGAKAAQNPSIPANWLAPNQNSRRIEIRFTQLNTQAKR